MKKKLVLAFGMAIILTLSACGSKETVGDTNPEDVQVVTLDGEAVNNSNDLQAISEKTFDLHDMDGNVAMSFSFPAGYADYSVDPESGEKVAGDPYEYSTTNENGEEIGITIGANIDDGSTRYISITCYGVEPDMSYYDKVGEVSGKSTYTIYKYDFDGATFFNLTSKDDSRIQISFGVDGVWADDKVFTTWTQADVEAIIKSYF